MIEIYEETQRRLAEQGIEVSLDVIAHCDRHQAYWLKEELANPTTPAILLNNFGSFTIMPGRLKQLITSLESKEDLSNNKQKRLELYRELLPVAEEFKQTFKK